MQNEMQVEFKAGLTKHNLEVFNLSLKSILKFKDE